MGRQRKPTALKLLNGSAAHDPQRINPDEPVLEAEELKAPTGLTRESRKEWDRVMPILANSMKVLTQGDFGVLVAYCSAYGELVWAQRDIRKNGRMIPVYMIHKLTGEPFRDDKGKMIVAGFEVNPAVKIQKDALASMRAYASALGLSPADRSKVSKIDAGSEKKNPMLELLTGKKQA